MQFSQKIMIGVDWWLLAGDVELQMSYGGR